MNETAKLTEFVAGLEYSDLPPEVIHTAKLCLLDTMGVGLFASQMPWTKMVSQVGKEQKGEQTLNAFGLAGFMAAGISDYSEDGSTSMMKRLMGG